jgi:hypothetical protein
LKIEPSFANYATFVQIPTLSLRFLKWTAMGTAIGGLVGGFTLTKSFYHLLMAFPNGNICIPPNIGEEKYMKAKRER